MFGRKMIQRVFGIRDFPDGCGTPPENPRSGNVNDLVTVTRSESEESSIDSANSCVGGVERTVSSVDSLKEVESLDSILMKAGFNVTSSGSLGSGSSKRNFIPACGGKVKPLSPEESRGLVASRSLRRTVSDAVSSRDNTCKSTQQAGLIPVVRKRQIAKVLTPREKVLKALNVFKVVFNELDRDKAARRGLSKSATSRIDYKTRSVLARERKQVNAEKRIGAVPGIQVGDVFQYKSQLNLIGLHFDIMGGIDYMSKGDLKLATSIVSSEGNGYSDVYKSGVLVYTGEGGNGDQKLVRGNLALANSMKEQTPVRVIRGQPRMDLKGKHYVYDGLYLVEKYWQERGGAGGNLVFKFKLVRVSGQPSVDLKR